MRPMIRLGNLNARPSCPAAAPGSTVWVYLYAAGRRDMPGDSPRRERASERDQGAGREICGRLCQRKAAAPVERNRNLHQQEPDSPEQDTFTGHTPETQQNRRPENRRRLDLRAAQAMR